MVSELVDTDVAAQTLFSDGISSNRNRIDMDWLHKAQEHPTVLEIQDGISVGKKEYTGPWFAQTDPSTCTPIAMVNACAALDISPPVDTFSMLLNTAMKDEGMHYFYAQSLLLKKPTQAFTLSYWKDARGYRQIAKYRDAFQTLAGRFIEQFESDRVILASMDSQFGRSDAPIDSRTHSIALSGYEVTPDGAFNLQVLDPDQGVYWLPFEYVTSHMVHELHTLQKGSVKPVLSPYLLR